jgi:hypothetical protein
MRDGPVSRFLSTLGAARRDKPMAGNSRIPLGAGRVDMADMIERSLLLQGRLAARIMGDVVSPRNLADIEFRVSSQWGEDGIIDWLISHVEVPNHRFIEFGVDTFAEANCRFLLQNRNWKGLVLDGSADHMAALRREPLYWMYDLTAKAAFVTAENINGLISGAGFAGPVGLLSIDIDGNDYWVWNAIDVIDPAIVVCEYNPILGDMRAITVPYNPKFTRFAGHYSGLYFGASIAALKHLAARKGYAFVGTNSNGINAFFVKERLAAPVLEKLREVRAFCSRHRDSRDRSTELSFTGGRARLDLIRDCPVVDVTTGTMLRLGEIDEPYSVEWQCDME